MVTRAYSADEEEDIEALVVGGLEERYLEVETKKLMNGPDPFTEVPYKLLDKNAKRRADRLVKSFLGNSGPAQVNNDDVIDPKGAITGRGGKPKSLTPEQVFNGYFLWHLATPPLNLEYLTELASANSTHWACIRAKATNIVGLGHSWEPTNKVKNAVQDAQDDDKKSQRISRRLMSTMENLDELLEELNNIESFKDTLLKIWQDVEATGNGYMEVGRNLKGEIGYVGHVPSYNMRVRVDRDGFVQMLPAQMNKLVFFRNFGDKTTSDIFGKDPRPNEIIHFKKEHFKNAYYGIPDIIPALAAVAGDKFAQEYNLEYFENKAVPRYALIVKGAKLSATAERKILDYFRKEVKGKHHGTLYIPVPTAAGSNVDVELKAIENEVQEQSFSGYRDSNRVEILMAHRVPGSQVGIELSNLSQSRESTQVFKDQVCTPEQERVEWKINLIIKTFTDMFKFRFKTMNLLDEETVGRIQDRQIRNGTINPNEARADLGKPPRVGGEKYQDPGLKPMTDPEDPALELQQQQADQQNMLANAKPGPPRITTDGSPKNNSPMTPADQSSRGRASKFEAQDKSGQAPRRIGQ